MSEDRLLDQVINELRSLTPEELQAEMAKHRDDPLAVTLREINGVSDLSEEDIRRSMQYGSKWNHEDPKWLTKSEVIKAIKHSHGILE
jgi:hypothetical protein